MRKTILIIKKIYYRYKYYLGIIKEYNPYESIIDIQKRINIKIISILENIDFVFNDNKIINNSIGVIRGNRFYTLKYKSVDKKDDIYYINSLNLDNDNDLGSVFKIYNSDKYYNQKAKNFNKNIIKIIDKDLKIYHGTNSLKSIKNIEKYGLDTKYLFAPIFFTAGYDYAKNYYTDLIKGTGKVYEITLNKGTQYLNTRNIDYLASTLNIEDRLRYLYLLSLGKIKFINYMRGAKGSNMDWFLNYNPGILKSNEFYNNPISKYIYRIIAYIEGLKLIRKFKIYNEIIKKYNL